MSETRRGALAGCVPALAVVLVASACAGPGAADAGELARVFAAASAAGGDPGRACDLLAPGTRAEVEKQAKGPCPNALSDAGLPAPSGVRSVEVYGHDARVVLEGDVLFLARFPEGWRVTAAGCTPRGEDEPYDCQVSGG